MVPTTVHLLRHGEVHNPAGVLYGRLPGYRLSARGEAMARMVADHLAGSGDEPRHDVTLVVASPLERAQQTAAPLAEAFDLEVATDVRLIEAENHFQGRTFGVGDGSLRHPEHWPHLVNPFRPSWGEPYREQADRMLSAVDSARVRARGHEAVLVSHQLPVWMARCAAEGRRLWHDPRRRQCSLASLTSFRFEDDVLVGIRYSEPAASLLPGAATVSGA
ncbi:histidine phosphatase family protein [Cellulomonas marina]|uniref:Broad specificity phosphatase PhoE n=1 Tax=Cellulomonas marina TaxID=988821 RepID=A0A1I0XKN5_9CELL|nr:histidine phosphatase family protein [Cellulomonas marina]GIG30076.1 phosphoglycerate mutase [Cellulomonas marina]SFB00778.1 Broad specificity phosphatase PhoE [Cellulomonas marina]